MNWGGAFLEKGPSPLPKPHPLLFKDCQNPRQSRGLETR